jgi:putative oxidoreductase
MSSVFDRTAHRLTGLAPAVLPVLARFGFAAVLLCYFWRSAATKLGPDLWHPSIGAYYQIFPRAIEAVSGDVSQLGLWHRLVIEAGTAAEFALPLLILVGLATRLASLGMIGFILVQSLTDIFGHGVGAATVGAWFDGDSGAAILDQRLLWVILLAIPVLLGAGPLSLDRVINGRRA